MVQPSLLPRDLHTSQENAIYSRADTSRNGTLKNSFRKKKKKGASLQKSTDMVQESGTFAAYNGKISDIPQASTTSPGLGFLKLYLCTVDALEQRYASPPLMDFLAKHCVSITNGSDPFPAARLPEMFTAREKMLSKFTHDGFPIRAFDLERSDGKRTVICEAVSV